MRSRLAFGLLVSFLSVSLAGCGFFDFEERDPWRAQAEAACFARGEVKLTSLIQRAGSVEGKGTCGLDRPLRVTAVADGQIRIGSKAVVMSCPMTAALERWVRDVVMPAAWERYGAPVVELRNMGTYNCRTRNNRRGAKLSEHAFANAIDISGFVLANGYVVTVKKGWRGAEADRNFLRAVHAGACGPFSTVLGPGSDGAHEDHFHFDLARHDAKGTRRYCRPKPVVPPSAAPPVWADQEIPVAEVPPGMQTWPRVLPQTMQAVDAAAGLPPMQAPPPPAYDPRYVPPAPVGAGAPPAYPVQAYPAQAYPAPVCPPGYICTPAANAPPLEPPPVGWNIGAQPLQGYSDTEITGSLPEEYSDH